jgi:hypothetical protein
MFDVWGEKNFQNLAVYLGQLAPNPESIGIPKSLKVSRTNRTESSSILPI